MAVSKSNKVTSLASNYREPSSVSATKPTLALEEALTAAEKHLNGTRVDCPTDINYYFNDAHIAVLVYVVQIRTLDDQHDYETYVDATTGEVVGLIDHFSHVTYQVLVLPKKDPRDGLALITDPQNLNASPRGWHSDTSDAGIRTAGNNAIVFLGDECKLSQVHTTSEPTLIYFTAKPLHRARLGQEGSLFSRSMIGLG